MAVVITCPIKNNIVQVCSVVWGAKGPVVCRLWIQNQFGSLQKLFQLISRANNERRLFSCLLFTSCFLPSCLFHLCFFPLCLFISPLLLFSAFLFFLIFVFIFPPPFYYLFPVSSHLILFHLFLKSFNLRLFLFLLPPLILPSGSSCSSSVSPAHLSKSVLSLTTTLSDVAVALILNAELQILISFRLMSSSFPLMLLAVSYPAL